MSTEAPLPPPHQSSGQERVETLRERQAHDSVADALREAEPPPELDRRTGVGRRQADSGVEQARAFAAAFDFAQVIVRDVDGRIRAWTRGAERLYSWSAEEVVGTMSDGLLRTEFPVPLADIEAALARDGEWHGELTRVAKDGSRVTVASHWVLKVGDDGRSAAVIEVNNDISDVKRAEAALRASEARLRALQEVTSALGSAVTVEEVADVVANHAARALNADTAALAVVEPGGATVRVIRGRGSAVPEPSIADWINRPLDLAGAYPIADAIRSDAIVLLPSLDAWHERYPDLAPIHAARGFAGALSVPCRMGGRVLGALSLSFARAYEPRADDLTAVEALTRQCALALERARLYEANREALARAEAARERSDLLAEAGRVLTASFDVEPTLAAVARLAVPSLADWCLVHVVEPDGSLRQLAVAHRDPDKVRWAREFASRNPIDIRRRIGVPNVVRTGRSELYEDVTDGALAEAARGKSEWFAHMRQVGMRSLMIVPMTVRGRTMGTIVLVTAESGRRYSEHDLPFAEELGRRAALAVEQSELYAAERAARAEAEAANRAKSEFLAVMSHELRTPLNAIAGYAQLMELGVRGPVTEIQREDLRRIQKSEQHLLGLINEVLNYARLETGSVRYDMDDVPLAEIVFAVEALVAPQLRARRLSFAPVVGDERLAVRADREKLQQILVNLLSNAVKFTDPGGRIELACETTATAVTIEVRDSGIGIAADKLQTIFEPFVQINTALTRTREGVGLGLAISRDLARGMGGDLTVRSVEGGGSTFTLTLPRASPRTAE